MPVLRRLGFSLFFLLVGFQSPAFAEVPLRAGEITKTLQQNLRWCGSKLRALVQYINPREQGIHSIYEKGLRAKALRGAHELGKFAELLLSPLPVSFVTLPTDPIFLKLWRNPNFTPSDEEWALLDRYKLRDVFSQKKNFMIQHPRWVKVQRGFVYARRILLTASIALALNHGIQAGVPISRDQYVADARYALGPTQIQLINESVPFPHTAIRMGDKVYSYGYTHLSVRPLNQYLMNKDEYARRFQTQAAAANADSSASMTNFAADQLQKLPRSVQIVTLNLTAEEYASLKRDLELSTGNRYHNVTLVHDCTTMVMGNLEENTGIWSSRLFDASPSQTFFYFSALESLGSSRVADIFQVAIDSPKAKVTHTMRNLGITIMESKFFIDLLIYDQPHRLYLDIAKAPNQLEWREPGVQKEIDSWEADIRAEFADATQWRIFDRLALTRDRLTPEERAEVLRQIEDFSLARKEQWLLERDAAATDFKTIVLNDFRLKILEEKLAEYRQSLTR